MQKVIITGATDGIGKALVKELYGKYELIITGRSKEKMDKILLDYPNVYARCFDITNYNELDKFINDIKDKFNHIDYIINNAGANIKKREVKDLNIDELRYMIELNCISNVILIQGFINDMINRKEGHIINVLSSCCLYNNVTMSGYTASKKAMEAISSILMKEVKDYNVKVTNIYPGGVDTNFRANKRKDYLRPETIAKTIHNCMLIDDGNIQEIVIRPSVENNY